MKRAFLIFGMEGSGTNMMAEALVAAGCRHVYETDEINDEDELIVIRRSYPHAGKEPNLEDITSSLRATGMHSIILILVFRDENSSRKSIMRRDPKRTYWEIILSSSSFWGYLGRFIPNHLVTEVLHVTYESFTTSEGYRKWLFEYRLNLPFPADYKVENRNLKYYE